MEENVTLLNVREVSKYFNLHARTIQRLSKQGKIKAVKLGRQWKFFKEDIEKYLSFGINLSKEPIRISNIFAERRTYPRINTNFKCRYTINLMPFKEIRNEGIIKNLSEDGIFLFSQSEKLDLDDPIGLDFDLVTKTKIINIKAEGNVLRKDNCGAGISFRNIDKNTQKAITKYIG